MLDTENVVDRALSDFRSETAPLTEMTRERARRQLLAVIGSSLTEQRRSTFGNRRFRLVAAAAVGLSVAVVAVLAGVGFGSHSATDTAQAAVQEVAHTASLQAPLPALKPGQYLHQTTEGVVEATAAYSRQWLDRKNKVCSSPPHSESADALDCNTTSFPDAPTGTLGVSAPVRYSFDFKSDGSGGGSLDAGKAPNFASSSQEDYAAELQKVTGDAPEMTAISMISMVTNPAGLGEFNRATQDSDSLNALPTDPARLRDALASIPVARGTGQSAASDAPGDLFRLATSILRRPFASPDLRAALITVLGSLPGATVDTTAQDIRGRSGLGISMNAYGVTQQVVLDHESSALLGERYELTKAQESPNSIDRVDSGSYSFSFEPYSIDDKSEIFR